MGAQECLLLDGLDALGNDGHPERLAHADDRLRDGLVLGIFGRSRTKERSILMVSIGNCFISDIDE